MKEQSVLHTERRLLYQKIIYIYFGLYSTTLADRFSVHIAYGAALYFSLSALMRMYDFIIKTQNPTPKSFVFWGPRDSTPKSSAFRGPRGRLSVVLKTATVIFFILTTAYIIVLYPLLNPYRNAAFAMALVALPFAGRAVENALLRRNASPDTATRGRIARITLSVELLEIAAAALLAMPAGSDAVLFVLGGMAVGMVLCFFRQYVFRDYSEEYIKPVILPESIRHIRSVRLFDGMSVTSGVALNIFAFTYTLFLMFSRKHDMFLDFFVSFAGIALVFCAVFFGMRRALRSSLVQKIGKNAAYLLGTAIAIFAAYVLRDSWFGGVLAISVQTLLLLLGLTLQMSGAFGLKEDMLLLVRLYNKDIDEAAMRQRSARLDLWTSMLSEGIFLIVLLVLVSSPLFSTVDVTGYIEYAPAIGSSIAAIPTVLLLVSLVLSIKQPLTEKYVRRLKTYAGIRAQGSDNPEMEKRLRSVLVQKYKKRIGVTIIRAFLRPVMFHTVKGKEHVTLLPGIFVFNHREVYGPIAAVVFLPYDIRPWILYQMIDKKEIYQHMYEGTFRRMNLPSFLQKLIPRLISPIIVWALRSFDPIPVYRGAQANVIRTFSLSIECLAAGDSILLFPENPKQTYEEKVSDFYHGFANLGRLYYKKTGERLAFYPVYASKHKRELRIGEGVRYDPAGGVSEKNRIVETLEQRMRALQALDDA